MRALKRPEGINVIPLIDVMLVLLAIVLTISTFVASGAIKLDLPKASSATNQEVKNIEISIDKSGTIYFDKKIVTKDELISSIKNLSSDAKVSLRGDKKSELESFIFVLDQLKLQKIEKVSIITKIER